MKVIKSASLAIISLSLLLTSHASQIHFEQLQPFAVSEEQVSADSSDLTDSGETSQTEIVTIF